MRSDDGYDWERQRDLASVRAVDGQDNGAALNRPVAGWQGPEVMR
jgi:hypothetical protein